MPRKKVQKPAPKKGAKKVAAKHVVPEKKRRRRKDPNRPKRALSAFMFYSNEVREQVKAERPDLTFLQIAGEIGSRWRQLSDHQKRPYERMAAEDKHRYERAKSDYVPDPKYAKSSRKKKDPNAPKRNLSAYFFYCNDLRAQARAQHPDKKVTEIASLLAEQWRGLTASKKTKYERMAEKDKERYEREKAHYEAELHGGASEDVDDY